MKRRDHIFRLLPLLFALLLSAVSCNKRQNDYDAAANDSIVIIEELPDMKDYSIYNFTQKSMVIDDVKKELDLINKKIEELKVTIENKKGELEKELVDNYRSIISEMERSRNEYRDNISLLEKSRPDNWDSVKIDVANSYYTVVQSIDNVLDNAPGLQPAEPDSVKLADSIPEEKSLKRE